MPLPCTGGIYKSYTSITTLQTGINVKHLSVPPSVQRQKMDYSSVVLDPLHPSSDLTYLSVCPSVKLGNALFLRSSLTASKCPDAQLRCKAVMPSLS